MYKKQLFILWLMLSISCIGCGEKAEDVSETMRVEEHLNQTQEEKTDGENIIETAQEEKEIADNDINTVQQKEIEKLEYEAGIEGEKKSIGSEEDTENPIVSESEMIADNSITLVMAGDMLMHTPVNETGIMEDGSIDFSHLFTYTKDMIADADIALVNQEVILGGTELGISGYPAFNTYYELGDTLVETGFDVVLHATNHALDKGKKGVLSCLQYWENNYPDIAVLGIQDSVEEQEKIYVHEDNQIRVAILNYTYGTNGIPLPEDMPYAVNLMDKGKMAQDIAKAKEISDFVVVCPHWGTEYVLEETDSQRDYVQFFLECGVDLVLGTHPHVIEPVEMLVDEKGHEMLVYYSLGNYVNCTSSENDDIGNRMLGALAEVTITKDSNGQVYISEYSAEPIVTYVSQSQEEIAVYPLEQFTDEMANNSYTIKFDDDFSKGYCEELWINVIGDVGINNLK